MRKPFNGRPCRQSSPSSGRSYRNDVIAGPLPARGSASMRRINVAAHCLTEPFLCKALAVPRSTRLKAFTDTLWMGLEEQGIPITVTLVKPASLDTPFFQKARTLILLAAQHPLRKLIAGGPGAELSAARFAPRLAYTYMERGEQAAEVSNA